MSKKIEDYVEIEKHGDIAVVYLNNQHESINKIFPEMMDFFEIVQKELENDPEIIGGVIASKKKDFIAGADIEMFKNTKKKGDFSPISTKGHEILSRIANSPKPIVAAIHGSGVGAGTEIPLACTARIASDSRKTFLQLPEVMLGLLPGGGGTQRLPRLIGIQKALPIMLAGKKVYAYPALKMGLVDRVVPEPALIHSAVEFAREIAKKGIKRKDKRTFLEKLLEGNPIGRKIVFSQARKMVYRQTKGNYPAPDEIINCVEIGYKEGMEAGIAAEIDRFENLILTNESRMLIHLFFAMTSKKKNPYEESLIRQVDDLAMLGAGFMGAGIAEVSVTNDMTIWLKDIKDETLASAKQGIWKSFAKKVKRKSLTKVEADAYMDAIHTNTDYTGFDKADIVVEAVFEDLGLKQKIIKETEKHIREDCIFASNTSALPITKIADASSRPETVIGMHYFSPVPKMPLLEIVETEKTAEWVKATCFEVGIRQGKTCIVVKDVPGFYTTRILAPLLNEALLCLEEGADALQIDSALKKWGFPVGPITLIDEVGIDVGAHIMEGELMEEAKKQPGFIVSMALKAMADKGYAGRKNKKGFYQYDDKGKKKRGKLNPELYSFFGGNKRKKLHDEVLQHRIGIMMVKAALLCLEQGIVKNPLDGDVGAVFGLGFPPFTGGPFRFSDHFGLINLEQLMKKLSAEYGERFAPPAILTDYIIEKKTFYDDYQ